jgi:hypothetical protein
MASNEKNFKFFTYVDNDGTSWNLRGESLGAFSAVDGHTPADVAQPLWHRTKRNQPRRVVAQEANTGRIVVGVVYDTASFAAIAKGDVIAVQLPGLATTTNFLVTRKLDEKQQGTPAFSHNLADV